MIDKKKWKNWVLGSIGAFIAGAVLMLGGVVVGYPAISQLVGLAVAESATLWNNLRDAAAGDNLTNGIMASALMMYDGTNFDRARGDTTNGLDVDVTRISGNIGVSSIQSGTLLNSRTVSAANTATAITLTGVAATRVHLYKVQARCAGGSSFITVTDGGTTIYESDGGTVMAGTTYTTFEWPTALTGTTAASMVITLGACGTGNISVMSIQADQF